MFGKAALKDDKIIDRRAMNVESLKDVHPKSRLHLRLFLAASCFRPKRSSFKVFPHALSRLQI